MNPESVQRGESVTLTFKLDNCTSSDSLKEIAAADIQISGSGIEREDASAASTNCSFSIAAKVSPNAAIGTRDVLVTKGAAGNKRRRG